MSSTGEELQRPLAAAALAALDGHAFALAGSGAIREHGLVDRPSPHTTSTLFTSNRDPDAFALAVTTLTEKLTEAGYVVDELRRLASSPYRSGR